MKKPMFLLWAAVVLTGITIATGAEVNVEVFEVYGTVYVDVSAQKTCQDSEETIMVTVSFEGLNDDAISIEEAAVNEGGFYKRYELGEESEFGKGRVASVTVEESSASDGEGDTVTASWP